MKNNRIIALIALASLLLSAPALAAAGDADDPLISRSYIEGDFAYDLGAAADVVCGLTAASAAPGAPAGPGWAVYALAEGGSVTLGEGQQLVLLSGGVRLELVTGRLVNCTLGRASTGGDARTGHRYVAWGGTVRAECAGEAVVACSAGAAAQGAVQTVSGSPEPTPSPQPSPEPTPQPTPAPTPADCPFEDVAADAWYFADVVSAYRSGLVNGMTPTRYDPQGTLTLAQAVKLAACMHQKRAEGTVTLENAPAGTAWYESYAAYALAHGILAQRPEGGWNDPAARGTFVQIFYRALPEGDYAPINDVPEGAIPDVEGFDPGGREIYAFYAAGILTGYAEGSGRAAHEFGADTFISRAEVATILNRMMDPAARVRFTIG